VLAGLGVSGFLVFCYYAGERMSWQTRIGTEEKEQAPSKDRDDLDELDDFLGMQDDV